MKRIILLIFSLTIAVSLFSIDLEKSKELFLNYIKIFDNPDDEFLLQVKNSIEKDLPLYRYYKIELVGSVEKTDVTKGVGDYLNVIYNSYVSKDYSKQLARAAFFAYLEAKLERKSFESSFIKSSPNFNQFFNNYQSKVIFAARNYISDLFAKHLGASDINLPYDIDAPYFDFNFEYKPKFTQKEFENEIKILLNDKEIVKKFNEYLELISKNPERITFFINRYTGLMQRNIIRNISNLKNYFSEYFAQNTPKNISYWWIRWLVYIVIVTFFIKYKKWNLAIAIISIIEIIYLFVAFDILSNTDANIYGLIAFSTIIASSLIILKKGKIFNLVVLSLIIVSFFIPSFFTKSLNMKEQSSFQDSIYFNQLVQDVLKDKYSTFSNIVTKTLTIVNSSINNTESISNRISIISKELEKKVKTPEYKSIENFNDRIKDIENLKGEISNYIIEEQINKKQLNGAKKDIEKFSKKIAKFSSEKFENIFLKEFEKRVNFEEISPLIDTTKKIVASTKDLTNYRIYFYKTKYGIISFVLISVALFLYVLNNKNFIIWAISAFVSSIFMLINPIEFFVQKGVPTLNINYNFSIPILLLVSILILIKAIPKKGNS
ncbi:hypothetical protein SU69_00105 [Thermosipho melanesiensis]|uniref:Uncharacterized protein n=2 Tax=Thermosipho melanesiensis TaxID=46541 RepID=A6LIZ4_THEM4|nr:hypothetical protein [Thermosipho melanesiensis]ABR29895.1 hypothetical protein Tmel_0015 [Thermosipho melanesiensis BI429]APT73104.1 hypothetical protein BW47_00105 [Thermosipho melanesiensis]OOC38503.1 hypothetical protein SU68_00105 [Thermosipho melanesiensis]OOC40307.1 hypothetical protein SU70_00105 [Thermosipho melanesiensis]OOC40571.1 hypothetical protein SU69_00105 [Thermosipho melanesiensis]